MRRRSWGLFGGSLLGLLLIAPESQAFRMSIVNVTSTGASPTTLAVGDTVTIDLVVKNETRQPIYGIGVLAYGYDVDRNRLADDGLTMVGASTVASLFNTFRTDDGQALGGMPLVRTPQEIDFAYQMGGGPPMGVYTSIFGGISLTELGGGDGSLDTGLGGRTIAEGDVHFRIAFQATSLLDSRVLTLYFGSGPTSGPGNFGEGALVREGNSFPILPVEDAALTLTILADPNAVPTSGVGIPSGAAASPPIPEPRMALLLGLGLVGLAVRRGHA